MDSVLFTREFWLKVLYRWRGALCWERGAAMAFFALFSIAPLFVLVLSVLDQVFGIGVVRGEAYTTLVRALGTPTANAMRALLLQPTLFYGSWLSMILNALLTAIGSAALFRQMQRCLVVVWTHSEDRAHEHENAYLVGSFIKSFFALGALTVFVVGSLFVLAVGVLIGPMVKRLLLGDAPTLWPIVFAWISLIGATGIFAVLYATLAPTTPSRRRIAIASVIVFFSLFVAKLIIGSFERTESLLTLFGAGSAVVYLLLWCFLLAQTFLFAAVVAAVKTER